MIKLALCRDLKLFKSLCNSEHDSYGF